MKNNIFQIKLFSIIMLSVVASFTAFYVMRAPLEAKTEAEFQKLQEKKQEYLSYKSELDSFLQAQKDLETLSGKEIQPQSFFKKDETLVEEILVLENIAKENGLDMEVSGLSGTIKSANKAKTQTELYMIPANLSIKGDFGGIVKFLETAENLAFVFQINNTNFTLADNGKIAGTLNVGFYLQK